MDYQTLDALKRMHPAWRLLAADHAPFVISFLHHTFIQPNVRTLAQQEIIARMDDHLHHLRERLGEGKLPRTATEYLDEWARDDHGWLRKYYPPSSDEPHFDITPAAEKVIHWLGELRQRQFVGTESRLMMVFELLRQMTQGTEVDPEARIAELEKRRAQIDAEIARVRDGQIDLMDPTQIRDRFLQMAATAGGLLSDFREVEQNFRELDRAVREQVATWEGSKGALLAEIFGQRDAIGDSDQGKTFRAFWDFLMSPARQEELTSMLETVFALEAINELHPDARLLRIHFDWLAAGEIAQRTVARLSEQLRRYLDDQTWLENRRIMQLLRGIEQHAVAIRGRLPDGPFMELDDFAPDCMLPMDRPLYAPPIKPTIADQVLLDGNGGISADVLFEQVYVDKARLLAAIRRALQTRRQISLAEVVAEQPLSQGLAELVAYLAIAADDRGTVIDDEQRETIGWTDPEGGSRRATLPAIVFSRPARSEKR
jgi:flagellar motility protein MotE (MotC chaperone)